MCARGRRYQEHMMRKYRKVRPYRLTAFVLAVCILGGCAARERADLDADRGQAVQRREEEKSETTGTVQEVYFGARPLLIQETAMDSSIQVTPSVEPYTIEPDLGNVENLWQFYGLEEDDELTDKLAENGFVVFGDAGTEFFEIYENDRYEMIPNFVTVDSLMHTYHLYFAYLLKDVEKTYLSERLEELSRRMLEDSLAQYGQLKGSEWEQAAERNVAFFTVGAKLLDDSIAVDDAVGDLVQRELDQISQASGIAQSGLTGAFEDYTQYIPRGYYEGDEALERYFKAMMWYGRIHFAQKEEDMDRSALLIAKALADDKTAYGLWESIYAVTSFFAGASDDLGVCEYIPAMLEAYGEDITVSGLIGQEGAFAGFHALTAELPLPQINSIPVWAGEENVIRGFRFMGQRFTIDAAVMQQLVYSNVQRDAAGNARMLPDVLDVPAALGSDTALGILEGTGVSGYAGYTENMERLRTGLSQADPELWSASLYAGWLDTLRPLLDEKGEGYPVFMQNEEWAKKDLECFAGSYTELKHDTILYAKQVIAEMGGGLEEIPDDRGYVQPEPLVYARFARLADQTAQGLARYGMLDAAAGEDLSRLTQIAGQLLTISEKELQDQVLTDEEYEFIRTYGGSIEHFWHEIASAEMGGAYVAAPEYPAAIVADIATDPDNGVVLEAATGNPSIIYVVVRVDGKIKIARGSVYSFYQFPWPMDDRLTDTKWRQMMGIQADEEGVYHYDSPVGRPEWTDSYRYRYEWE